MSQPAPGRYYRQGMSLKALFRKFPNDETAESWFVKTRWPHRIACHCCGSTNVQTGAKHKTMPFRCREKECAKRFSVRTGTVMQSSKLGYQTWAIAAYLMSTNLKGISSMKLHREVDITQKSAWHLAHRLRAMLAISDGAPMAGPVEADETFIGGKESNKHETDRKHDGRGAVGKVAVAGVKDRPTNRVRATVVASTDGPTLRGFVQRHADADAMIYTDGEPAYASLPRHEVVKHSVGEYVRGEAHTNGMESFWATLKRGYFGVYHHMSPEHLDRYVGEFEGRHNARPLDTIEQMTAMVHGAEGKRLRYADLINHGNVQTASAI